MKRFLLVFFLVPGITISAWSQNYQKMMTKGHFKQMHRALDHDMVNNPDDVEMLYYYSKFYQDTLNPEMNIYQAYLKAVDAYSAYENKASKHKKEKLEKEGITGDFLIKNMQSTCRFALRDLDKSPSLFKYEDYLSKYKNGGNYLEIATVKRDSFVLKKAQETNTESAYQEFIDRYPSSTLIHTALHLRDKAAYEFALSQHTSDALETFMNKYPASEYRYPAKLKRDSTAYAFAEDQNTEAAYQKFIDKYPDALQVKLARGRLEDAAYINAINGNTMEALDNYLAKYPNTKHAEEIKQKKAAYVFRSLGPQRSIKAYYQFILDYPASEQVPVAWDSILSIAKAAHDEDAIHTLLNYETNPDRKLKLWNIYYEVYTWYDGLPAIESFENKYPDNPLKDRIAQDKARYGKK